MLEYIVDFPVWYLVNTEHGNIMGGTRKKGERFVPIFSDEDLAERFVAPKPEAAALFKPVSVAGSEFVDFLDTIEGEGFTHVSLDIKPGGKSPYGTIKQFRDAWNSRPKK